MFVLRIALFLAIVLIVVVGGHVYLYRRLFRDTTDDRRIRRIGAVALTVAGASLFLARAVFSRIHTGWGDALAFAAWCWMGVGLYLGMSLAVFHLWRRVEGWRRSTGGRAPRLARATPVPRTGGGGRRRARRCRLQLLRRAAGLRAAGHRRGGGPAARTSRGASTVCASCR